MFDEELKRLPISLTYIQDLLERVSEQYPALPKYKVALIIRSFFECIREQLLNGKTITINNIFPNLSLYTAVKFFNNKHIQLHKLTLSTPKKLKCPKN
jgi:hypothetical protein